MKKFIQRISFLSIPLLIMLVGVNYFVDVAQLFHSDYVVKMAGIIKNGENVTNISDYDERLFEKEVVKNFKTAPDVLILGSSRTMLINSNDFKGRTFFNSSVSGASIEDIVSIYQLYKSKHLLPKLIMIGIDPWIFNKNNDQKRWQSLRAEYTSFFNGHEVIEINQVAADNKYLQLLSPSYFQGCLKGVPGMIKEDRNPRSTKEKYNKTSTKLVDGSLVYAKDFREATPVAIKEKAEKYILGEVYSLERFDALSPKSIALFKLLISDLKKNKIEIIFFLAPYHPIVYPLIESKYRNVIKTEDLVVAYAKANNIKIYGSYQPRKLNLNELDFYDGMHCNEAGVKKILNLGKYN